MSEMVYKFSASAHFRPGFDREAGAAKLASILERDGSLELPAIIEEGRNPSSPLHPQFNASEAEKVQAYDEQTADYLRRHLVVVVTDTGTNERREYRATVPVITPADADHRRSVSIITAMSDEDMRNQILWQALKDLTAMRRKYRDLDELARIFAAIDAAARKYRKEAVA